jgi:hypothetical protein
MKEYLRKAGCEMGEYFSIEEICKKNDFVFVDTCSFEASFFEVFNKKTSPDEKLEKMRLSNNSFCFWINRIPLYKNIYTTEGVIDEIRDCRYKYKKSIKKPAYRKEDNQIVLKLRRELASNKRNKINLVNLLEFENRILKIDEEQKETYDEFYKKYSFLADKFNLSKVDLDLLISGSTLSKERNVSILSNDRGIRDSWRFLLDKEAFLGQESLCFYSTWGVNLFKQEKPNFQSKLSGSIIKI